MIRKFLDTQRTSQLSTYVEELHHRQRGYVLLLSLSLSFSNTNTNTNTGPSHTALLLNCYTKMRDQDALNRFTRMGGRWTCDERCRSIHGEEWVKRRCSDTKPLRAAGFYDNALYLAKRHERHAQFCEIQVEDIDNAKAATTYLETLSDHPDIVASIMKRHCLRMLPVMPQRVTTLLQSLCSSEDLISCRPEDFFHWH